VTISYQKVRALLVEGGFEVGHSYKGRICSHSTAGFHVKKGYNWRDEPAFVEISYRLTRSSSLHIERNEAVIYANAQRSHNQLRMAKAYFEALGYVAKEEPTQGHIRIYDKEDSG
jgi:hypothetical protein